MLMILESLVDSDIIQFTPDLHVTLILKNLIENHKIDSKM